MDHIDNVYEGLQHYFNVLELTGNYKEQDAQGLMIYSFITDQILNGPLWPYLDDKGLGILNKAIKCIARNNCLIDIPATGMRISEPRGIYVDSLFRTSEYGTLRNTEKSEFRTAETATVKQ